MSQGAIHEYDRWGTGWKHLVDLCLLISKLGIADMCLDPGYVYQHDPAMDSGYDDREW